MDIVVFCKIQNGGVSWPIVPHHVSELDFNSYPWNQLSNTNEIQGILVKHELLLDLWEEHATFQIWLISAVTAKSTVASIGEPNFFTHWFPSVHLRSLYGRRPYIQRYVRELNLSTFRPENLYIVLPWLLHTYDNMHRRR